jgi:hypothetical protein
MSADIDYDLTSDQWEALKALRVPALKCSVTNPFAVEDLVALLLAERNGDHLTMTPKGRRVLLRGSPQLWDVAV